MKIRAAQATGFGLVGLTIVLLFSIFPAVRSLFNEQLLVSELHQFGPWSGILFVLIFTLATALGFPGNIMTVAGGAVFGLFWGTVWSTLGATLGAVGAFWLARYFLFGWLTQTFGHHRILRRLQTAIDQHPLAIVLAVRFTPLSPFSLVNFLFGLTPISLKTYTIGTFVGIIPLTLAYCWLGVAGQQALSGGDQDSLLLSLTLLSLLSVSPFLIRNRS